MITAQRLHERRAHLTDLKADGEQLVEARYDPVSVKAMGELVHVGAELAKPTQ
jgi:hypothetical protein